MKKITICILTFGDNLPYIKRCLNSIIDLPTLNEIELRIGFNSVPKEIIDHISDFIKTCNKIDYKLFISDKNICKYPMMRRMFYNNENPITTEKIMWFDDDSYITTPTRRGWYDHIIGLLDYVSVCGKLYSYSMAGNQHEWIKCQKWYRGKPINIKNNKYIIPKFPVGGWWAAKMSVLKVLDWPPVNIIHRGGDAMLGEALRQNDYDMSNFISGVAINASLTDPLKQAPRRGENPLSVGINFTPSLTQTIYLNSEINL